MLIAEHCGRRLYRGLHTAVKCCQGTVRQINTNSSAMSDNKFSLPDRYAGFGSSVWYGY